MNPPAPRPLILWIAASALVTCGGWGLSLLHALNRGGYLVLVLAVGVALAALWRSTPSRIGARTAGGRLRQYRRRFSRPFPLAFLVLAFLALLGGLLHPPTNYDGLAYRIPRILHWLSEDQWHWIHTAFPRLNTRAPGWEWLAAPLISLTGSFQGLFLVNGIAYLFMPGLVFSLFRRMGVRSRMAWYWMWLLPAGYCFLLQAGSISNDLGSAIFALAAVDFALRAQKSGRLSEVWLSILSAALLSTSKSSALPLLLPFGLALLPVLKRLWKKPVESILILILAAGASILPISWANYRQSGDWTGRIIERPDVSLKKDRGLTLATNTVLMTIQNLVPPIFPLDKQWNAAVARTVPASLTSRLEEKFPSSAAHFQLREIQMEQWAGLGFGLSLLILATAGSLLFTGRQSAGRFDLYHWAILLSPWVSFLVLLLAANIASTARVATPFYALLLPALLVLVPPRLTRRCWWRTAAFATFIPALILVAAAPSRPLWPATSILEKFGGSQSSSPLVRRAYDTYSFYAESPSRFSAVWDQLPREVQLLGFVTFDDPEGTLWMPLGERRVAHVLQSEGPEALRSRGIEYILVRGEKESPFLLTLSEWSTQVGAETVAIIPIKLKASSPATEWHLVRLSKP